MVGVTRFTRESRVLAKPEFYHHGLQEAVGEEKDAEFKLDERSVSGSKTNFDSVAKAKLEEE